MSGQGRCRGRTCGVLATPIRVSMDEGSDTLLRFPGLRQCRNQLEHMRHALPYLQLHRHAGGISPGRGAHRVVQQHFRAAHLEQ